MSSIYTKATEIGTGDERSRLGHQFQQGKPYSIGQLRIVAAEIIRARQLDQSLSAMMRTPNRTGLPWAKSWNEELFPLKLFADHTKLPDHATFEWTPDGAADFEVRVRGDVIRLQNTMAYPEWSVAAGQRGGYIRHREMKQYNANGYSYGGGFVSRPRARGTDEDLAAWRSGIKAALTAKLNLRCAGCRLLIFASGCQFDTIDFDFEEVVMPAIDQVGNATWGRSFEAIYVLDAPESALVEVRSE